MVSDQMGEQKLAKPWQREVPRQYPSSSDVPVGENTFHSSAVISLRNALEHHFSNSPDVFVSGRLAIWLEDGNEADVMRPDVIVALDTLRGERQSYYVWVEGKPPDFACDVLSGGIGDSWRWNNWKLAQGMGVREYVAYDPGYNGSACRMKMYRLEDSEYVEVVPNERGEFESPILGLGIQPDGDRLRVRDLASGKSIPSMSELSRELQSEQRARRAEARARIEAERRVAALQALIQSPS